MTSSYMIGCVCVPVRLQSKLAQSGCGWGVRAGITAPPGSKASGAFTILLELASVVVQHTVILTFTTLFGPALTRKHVALQPWLPLCGPPPVYIAWPH